MRWPSRQTYVRRLEDRYKTVRGALTEEIAHVLLLRGQGAFFLQLDSVKCKVSTNRGVLRSHLCLLASYSEPILIAWVDNDWKRQLVVLGLGYQTGKSAMDSANNVRTHIKALDLLGAIQAKIQATAADTTAAQHYKAKMDEYRTHFHDVETAEAQGQDQDEEQVEEPAERRVEEDDDDDDVDPRLNGDGGDDAATTSADSVVVSVSDTSWIAALVLYMIGAVTADGALKPLCVAPTISLQRDLV